MDLLSYYAINHLALINYAFMYAKYGFNYFSFLYNMLNVLYIQQIMELTESLLIVWPWQYNYVGI